MLPDVYFFNPTCEYAVANGTVSWQPNRVLKKMENDLDVLPLYFSKSNDFIFVNKLPSEHFIDTLKLIGISPPKFITEKQVFTEKFFHSKQIGKLLPWGWSPATHHFLNPLKDYCSEEFKNSPVFSWQEKHKELPGKQTASGIARKVLKEVDSEILIPEGKTATSCTTIEEIKSLHKKWGKLMVKAPWSTSGRGLQPLTKSEIHPSLENRIKGLIHDQGFVMVEPFFDKIADLAFQFKSEKGEISFMGFSFFETDNKGQYKKNFLNGVPQKIEKRISEIMNFTKKEIIFPLIKVLEVSGYAQYYEGNFGVDALIFNDEKNNLRLHPCLEINLRYNMGLLSFYLEKLISPGKKGTFSIYYNPKISFKSFSNRLYKTNPLVLNRQKIYSGYLPLTEPKPDSFFGAYLLIT